MRNRHTDEQILEACQGAESVKDVLRKLGMKVCGGNHAHITMRMDRLKVDRSGFGRSKGGRKKFTLDQTLSRLPEGSARTSGRLLKRAMLQSGLTYSCRSCILETWQGKPIVLDVDHIDGDWLNNTIENLRFLCPNCHRQTNTFGSKNMLG